MSVTISGSGQIIKQIVQTVVPTIFTTSSTSPVDFTGLTATITPTNASNKILIMLNMFSCTSTSGYGTYAYLLRNGTNIGGGTVRGSDRSVIGGNHTSSAGNYGEPLAFTNYMDSPATTSPVVYKIQVAVEGTTGTFGGAQNTASYCDSMSSIITLMEVAYA